MMSVVPVPRPDQPPRSKRSSPGLAHCPDERIAHRDWIGGAVKTLLTMYGDWPSDPRLEAEWGKAWANDLEWFPAEVIESALNAWRRIETKRPTPAAIIKLCREAMPQPKLVAKEEAPPEEPRVRVTAERIVEMMEEVGLITPEQAERQRANFEGTRESLRLGLAAAEMLQRTAEARRMPTARE